jgi:type IV secretory pathway VirB10-like protein
MNDFWETGIYIVITVGALLVAMIIILLLSATSKPKKSRKRLKGQAGKKAIGAPSELMMLAEGGAKEDKQGKKGKKGKPPKPEKQAKKSKQEKQEEERQRKEEKQAAGQADKQPVAAAPTGEGVEAPAVEDPKAAELPSVDTLDDSDDGSGDPAAANEDLMSIFQVEEAEDSYVSDLANKLFDVETSNIQALGLEVLSVFSRGKAAVETKEDENE